MSIHLCLYSTNNKILYQGCRSVVVVVFVVVVVVVIELILKPPLKDKQHAFPAHVI